MDDKIIIFLFYQINNITYIHYDENYDLRIFNFYIIAHQDFTIRQTFHGLKWKSFIRKKIFYYGFYLFTSLNNIF